MKSGPLSGIRVLDMTAVVLGPMATHILADYGAEVIKVEPLEGDLIRANGVSVHRGMSSIHLALNRNKRSLALDLKSPEGREILQRLIPGVDVLVHNMRVRAIERLGFGYERARELNPGIIYCFATGFGQDGPYRDKPAFDDIIQSASGLVGLNRANLGAAEYAPTLLADKTVGVYLANAVLAGLVHRLRSGEGQSIEVPMFETMTAFVLAEHLGGFCFEPQTEPFGYTRVLAGGRRPIPTLDGHVSMLPYTEHHWTAFLRDAGHEEAIEQLPGPQPARAQPAHQTAVRIAREHRRPAHDRALDRGLRTARHPRDADLRPRSAARASAPEGGGALPGATSTRARGRSVISARR